MKKRFTAAIVRTTIAAALIASAAAMTGCSKAQDKTASEDTTAIESEADGNESSAESVVTILETESSEDAGSEASDDYYSKDPLGKAGTVNSVNVSEGTVEVETFVSDGTDSTASSDTTEPVIFHVADGVPIVDAVSGDPVGLDEIKDGSFVYAWMGDAMAQSLPPQTSLQAMVVNIPADAAAPVYTVVKGIEWSKDDTTLTITGNDGSKWTAVNDKTQAVPYRTKQIVKLMDIKPGSRIMVWGSEDSKAADGELAKVMIFNAE